MTNYSCKFCDLNQKEKGKTLKFYSSCDFYNHLKETHCVKEGGSYVCLYGYNGVCPSLPIEGVSEVDYKDHVNKVHGHSSAENISKMETDSNEKSWKTQNSSVNMAALLNNPRLSKRETDIFTKIWGEAFGRIPPIIPSPSIPPVSINYFKDFIKNTCANRTSPVEENKNEIQKKKNEVLSTRMHQQDPAIPKIFFRPDFDLTDKSMFEAVIQWDSIKQPSNTASDHTSLNIRDNAPNNSFNKASATPPYNPANNFTNVGAFDETSNSVKLLQEKLSHHLDNIEVQISKQICLKSHSFFQTMLSHYALHGHLENLCKSVHFLRERMDKISESMVKLPLNILQKTNRKRHYHRLLQKLHLMATVQQTQPTIQLLLSTNDFSGCLDLISTTHEVLSQELSGLHCFRHFGSQLLELEKVIVRMIEEEYTIFLTNSFNQPIDHSRISSISALQLHNLVTDSKPMDQEKLVLIGLGLFRHNNTDYINIILNESQTTVKTLIKQTVIEVVSTLELSDSDKNLTCQVRMLTHQQWQLLLSKLFYVLLVVLLRVKSVIEVLTLIGSRLVYKSKNQEYNDAKSPQTVQSIESNESEKKQENDREDKQRPESIARPMFEDVNDNSLMEFMSECDPVMLIDAAYTHHSSSSVQLSSSDSNTTSDPAINTAPKNLNNNSEKLVQCTVIHPNDSSFRDNLREEQKSCMIENESVKEGDVSSLKSQDAGEVSSDNDDSSLCDSFHQDPNWKQNIAIMIKDSDPVLSEPELANINSKFKDTLVQVLEFINHRTYKLFIVRDKKDPIERLSIEEFVELACHVDWFLGQGEKVTASKCSPLLRGHMRNQALKFVNKFHEEKKDKLCLILDNERWKQADVPIQFQRLVHHIVSTDQMSAPPKVSETENKGGQDKLLVAGEEYVVVGTVLILLSLMVDYCQFGEQVPCVAAEVLNKLVELLKSFNSRTCQLVLGAGAVHLGGLKTINTINLGLASRCLQLVLFFLPKVKNHFQTRLFSISSSIPETSKQQALKQLDILIKDYNEHIGEISVKMVGIIDQATINLITQYDPKSSSTHPSPIFEFLSKRTIRFIEATTDLLPRHQLEGITSQFHSNFILNLSMHLTSLGFNKDSPYKSSVEKDLKYYCSVMQQVDIFKDFSISIKDIITC